MIKAMLIMVTSGLQLKHQLLQNIVNCPLDKQTTPTVERDEAQIIISSQDNTDNKCSTNMNWKAETTITTKDNGKTSGNSTCSPSSQQPWGYW